MVSVNLWDVLTGAGDESVRLAHSSWYWVCKTCAYRSWSWVWDMCLQQLAVSLCDMCLQELVLSLRHVLAAVGGGFVRHVLTGAGLESVRHVLTAVCGECETCAYSSWWWVCETCAYRSWSAGGESVRNELKNVQTMTAQSQVVMIWPWQNNHIHDLPCTYHDMTLIGQSHIRYTKHVSSMTFTKQSHIASTRRMPWYNLDENHKSTCQNDE